MNNMKALTYSQIISILEDIARRSYKINSFFLGQDWELAQSEAPVYPCLQVYPLTSVMPISVMGDYKSVVFEIQCKLLDLVGQDQFNQKSVHNDLHAVAQSIVNEINQNPYFVRSFVKMVGDVQFVNLEEVNDDFLAGWGWIIRFEIRNLNTFCGQAFEPVDGYSMSGPSSSGYSPSVRYLTCDTVTGCTTFQDYIQNAIDGVVTDNYYTTGGTLVGTTIQFDRNDLLNAYEVQLSGLTSGITATGNYLSLSGGTVTGNTVFTQTVDAGTIKSGVIISGSTNLYDIFSSTSANLWSASTGANSIIANNGTGNVASGDFSLAGGNANLASGYASSVGGKSNLAEGNYSVIVGGSYNTTLQTASFIGAGGNNLASAQNSVVVGGSTNTSSGNYSAIVGGLKNYASASANQSFIGGGLRNSTAGPYSTIGGGQTNLASGDYSFVGGGQTNLASGPRSFVGGGQYNISSGAYSSVVVGGSYNQASAQNSFVGGGFQNTASGNYAFIGGGLSNTASNTRSIVVGGRLNSASASESAIVGGCRNSASGKYSVVVGGYKNESSGDYSSIVGGRNNTASGAYSMAAGSGNIVSGTNSAVLGGTGITGTTDNSVYIPNAYLASMSGTRIYSAGTDLYNIFQPLGASGGAYLNLSGGTVTGNTNFTVSLTATSISATTIFVTNEKWTIELVDALTAVFYAPYAMQINSITNILNSPSIAIYDDGALYTLTNTIATGSKILVSANTASVVSLNATK